MTKKRSSKRKSKKRSKKSKNKSVLTKNCFVRKNAVINDSVQLFKDIATCLDNFNNPPFSLSVRTVTIVPSTAAKSENISPFEFQKRIETTAKYMATLFGGYTNIIANGGYYSGDLKKVIREPVCPVESYASPDAFKKHIRKWIKWVKKKGEKWGQESMGIIINSKLFYIYC